MSRPVQRQADTPIPENNDVVVIGSGLGGLTCALELARNGLKVCVLEQHRVAGGYAHSFRRRGYHFDISLHYIGGLAPGALTHGVLSTLGVFQKLQVQRRETLFTAEFPELSVVLPNRQGGILDELSRLFPKERSGLVELFNFLPKLKTDVMAPSIDPDFNEAFENRISMQYMDRTFGDVLGEYISDPGLLALLAQVWMFIGLPPSLSTATFSTCVFCSSFVEGAFDITGGGAALVRAMVERLREMGGECVTRSSVKRIHVEDGTATGVELEDGQFVPARAVVSNANPYHTFFDLIPGDEISKIYRFRLKQMESSLSIYSLYLGLDCPPSELGIQGGNFLFNYKPDCEDAFRRAVAHEIDQSDWCVTSYEDSDDTMYPSGAGVVSFAELTGSGDWFDLDEETYTNRKREVQQRLITKYAKRFPGIEEHIAVSEFATPRTMASFTRNHRGAVYGLAQTVEQSNSKRLRNRSPVEGLFLTGAWTWAGGGYEGSIMTGVQTAGSVLSEMDTPRRAPKIQVSEAATAFEYKSERREQKEIAAVGLGDLDPDDEYYRFRISVNVYGDDLNSRGNADTSSYFRYMDRGRVEAIEAICLEADKESWLREYVVNVYRIDADCATIVGLGHRLEVQTGVRRISSHRASFDQRIVNLGTGEVVADAMVEVLFLDDERRLVPVPDELTDRETAESKTSIERHAPVPFTDEAHFPFRAPFRVYYEDTDCQGITYHVSYARFCERSLFQMVRAVWPEMTTRTWMTRHKVSVARMDLRYLNSSTLGDRLEVRTGVLGVTSQRITFGQRIAFQESGKVIADVTTEVEFRDENEKIVPIPAPVLDATYEALPQNGGGIGQGSSS